MKTLVSIKRVDGEINPFNTCTLNSALQIENNEITIVSMGVLSVVFFATLNLV